MNEPLEPRGSVRGHLSVDEVSECAFGAEEAAAGLLGHLAECAVCAGEVEDVRSALALLAEFPEPEVPESVVIRLDAAVEREWQQRDRAAEAAAQAAFAPGRGARRSSRDGGRGNSRRSGRGWRGLRVPITALAVICGGAVGLGVLIANVNGGQQNSAASTTAGSADGGVSRGPAYAGGGAVGTEGPNAAFGQFGASASMADSALSSMAAALIHSDITKVTGSGASPSPSVSGTTTSPNVANGSVEAGLPADCTTVPQHSGFVLTAAQIETSSAEPALLVLYTPKNGEPAYGSAFAVLYAGPCPSDASKVLDQGWIDG